MRLDEFISETLAGIINGVAKAQQLASSKGAVVSPWNKVGEVVEFDVAVTVAEGTEASGKAGINVFSIGAGVSGTTQSSTSTVNRIKFSINVTLPEGSKRPPHQTTAINT